MGQRSDLRRQVRTQTMMIGLSCNILVDAVTRTIKVAEYFPETFPLLPVGAPILLNRDGW